MADLDERAGGVEWREAGRGGVGRGGPRRGRGAPAPAVLRRRGGASGTGADGSRAGTDAPIIAGRAGPAQAQAMRRRSRTSSALSSAR